MCVETYVTVHARNYVLTNVYIRRLDVSKFSHLVLLLKFSISQSFGDIHAISILNQVLNQFMSPLNIGLGLNAIKAYLRTL